MADIYSSTHAGAVIDGAVTDLVALVGAGLSKNLVLGSGNGLDFSATGDAAGMTSELLDDYEEGTWTVLGADSSSAGNTAAPGASAGRYTKIGRDVFLKWTATSIDTTGMTAGNDFFLQGLPFAIAAGIDCVGSVLPISCAFTGSLTAFGGTSASAIRFSEGATGAGLDFLLVSELTDDTSGLIGTVNYDV